MGKRGHGDYSEICGPRDASSYKGKEPEPDREQKGPRAKGARKERENIGMEREADACP